MSPVFLASGVAFTKNRKKRPFVNKTEITRHRYKIEINQQSHGERGNRDREHDNIDRPTYLATHFFSSKRIEKLLACSLH